MGTVAVGPEIQQPREPGSLYDRDFYTWSMQQTEALKRRDFKIVDWDNVLEEIKSLGVAQKNNWAAYGARVIEHLLKMEHWDHSSDRVLRHWATEVWDFRSEMADIIDKNPGLKGQYAEMFAGAWKRGRRFVVHRLAEYEADRGGSQKDAVHKWKHVLPRECPYRFEHVTAYDPKSDQEPREDVWPPAVARILNVRFKQDYPIFPDYTLDRGTSRGFDWSR